MNDQATKAEATPRYIFTEAKGRIIISKFTESEYLWTRSYYDEKHKRLFKQAVTILAFLIYLKIMIIFYLLSKAL